MEPGVCRTGAVLVFPGWVRFVKSTGGNGRKLMSDVG